MPLPSIAYRLARIAVGDGIGTLTLRPVNALDIAAGHALLLAAGGVLVAEDGDPVTYNVLGESRPSACFGGAPQAVAVLRERTWRGSQESRREPRITLNWPRYAPELALDRAAGCLFGLAIGGDLGPEAELGLIVARSLVGQRDYDKAAIDAAVGAWVAAGGRIDLASPEVRAVAIGIWARDAEAATSAARQDSPGSPTNADTAALIASYIQGAPTRNGNGPFTHDDPRHSGKNPAILAAIAGATRGRRAFPARQVLRILTSRPNADLGVALPRPENCWTDDLVEVAEALLTQGQRTL